MPATIHDAEAPAYFVPDGDRFRATQLTRGPWSADHQHVGPPAALLGTVVERADGGEDKRVVRLTFEILRPVPITTLRTEARVVRPGGRVDLVEGALLDTQDTALVMVRAWRMRVHDVGLDAGMLAAADPTPPMTPGPDDGVEEPFFLDDDVLNYFTGTTWRFVEGAFQSPGPARAWARLDVPVVLGEAVTPLQRVLAVADSGNGISAVAWPTTELVFVNTDVTVHLRDLPSGEWVGLDSATAVGTDGLGLATTTLHDERGPIGRSLQSLWLDDPA